MGIFVNTVINKWLVDLLPLRDRNVLSPKWEKSVVVFTNGIKGLTENENNFLFQWWDDTNSRIDMHEYNRIKNAYPCIYAELSPLTDRCRTMAFSYLYYGYRALRQYLDAVQNFIFECQRLRLPTICWQRMCVAAAINLSVAIWYFSQLALRTSVCFVTH